jgi:hypothetical protein
MADDAVLDEIQENTKEAGQRLRASLSLLRSQGKLDDADYRELVSRPSTSLATYDNERLFHRDFFRTARSVVRPYGSKQGPESDEGAEEPWEREQETLFAEREGQTDVAGVYYHPAPRPPTPETL